VVRDLDAGVARSVQADPAADVGDAVAGDGGVLGPVVDHDADGAEFGAPVGEAVILLDRTGDGQIPDGDAVAADGQAGQRRAVDHDGRRVVAVDGDVRTGDVGSGGIDAFAKVDGRTAVDGSDHAQGVG